MPYSVLKRLLRCIGLFTVGRTENDRAVGKCCDIKLRSVPLLPQAAIESSSDAGMPLASNTPLWKLTPEAVSHRVLQQNKSHG